MKLKLVLNQNCEIGRAAFVAWWEGESRTVIKETFSAAHNAIERALAQDDWNRVMLKMQLKHNRGKTTRHLEIEFLK